MTVPRPSSLGSLGIQAKLTIGQPNDKYEQEVDQVASQVVQKIHAPASTQSPQGQSVQRMVTDEGEQNIQRKAITLGLTHVMQSDDNKIRRMKSNDKEDVQGDEAKLTKIVKDIKEDNGWTGKNYSST